MYMYIHTYLSAKYNSPGDWVGGAMYVCMYIYIYTHIYIYRERYVLRTRVTMCLHDLCKHTSCAACTNAHT